MPTTIGTGLNVRGLNGTFFPTFKDAPVLWRLICSLIQSTGSHEDYKWLGQLPMPREWKGQAVTQALRDFGQTIANKHWIDVLPIDRDEIDDDQTGQIRMRVQELARRFAQHPDKILIDLILAGETSTCYDGQFFFDTDHAEGVSGSQSNDLTLSATAPTNPTTTEFQDAFWQAIEALVGFVDDQGEPWNLFTDMEQMSGLLVVVPKNMLKVASTVLGVNAAPVIGQTSNILAGRAKVLVNARLTWTDKFAILKTDDTMRPFVFQNRKPITTEIEDVPTAKDIKYVAKGRYAVGYGLWQKAVLTTFV